MKADTVHPVSRRFVFLGMFSLFAGCYWNLGWFMALPFITLICPILISIFVARLFPNLSFGQRVGIYTGAVMVAEVVRNFLGRL